MPVIVAKRRGPCAACSLTSEEGEIITYERAVGPRHMACSERNATRWRNLFVMPCALWGVRLQRGQGELTIDECVTDGEAWRLSWQACCVDVQA
ncbi:hypothetical protein SAMN05444354_1446 [Stigmatella aurantiaca]|uniref:Uncharacterized protein n=1 Tax=Stigmatella aurantiaca TaxID=41 RepID=A0A1H8FYI4_STIAU|nr:hypothetical protein SAMN05444354_1446 [Stigmatella aurantiaca]